MDKFLGYYIIKEKRVIVEILKGAITVNEYIKFKTNQIEDEDFNPNFNFILDIRDNNIVFSSELEKKMKQYIAFEKTIGSLSSEKKVAVITNTPQQVVYSTLYEKLDERKIVYSIFSTKDEALKWLSLSNSDMDMII
ncbi:hypothetical protein [uncultured Draconibacterium sp.]|uniref:DUF7793 family protein n=1 Tax=uncultured Draconibacterium sp. TaxID=1573823 RepID=UPI0029C96E1E|nr:hypothetical protein [uncultured Draconibacterium sp.]